MVPGSWLNSTKCRILLVRVQCRKNNRKNFPQKHHLLYHLLLLMLLILTREYLSLSFRERGRAERDRERNMDVREQGRG